MTQWKRGQLTATDQSQRPEIVASSPRGSNRRCNVIFTCFCKFYCFYFQFYLSVLQSSAIVIYLSSQQAQQSASEPGRGEYSQKNWVGVCGPLPKTLTLFMTKICDIPHPILDLTKNSKPNLRPDPHIKILFHTCIIISSIVQTNKYILDYRKHNL